MTLLLGSLTIGLILALLAMGVYVSFRIFDIPDITTDGSITLGAATAAILIVNGTHPILATLAGAAAGALAGTVTGILHTKFKINALLAGILVMTALYSVNLHVMGRSNVPLLQTKNVTDYGETLGHAIVGEESMDLFGWETDTADFFVMILAAAFVTLVGLLLYWFFRTNVGTAMRATGNNPQMIRALGANVERYMVFGLAVSNGLVALAGAILAQYQGFADAQMGIGMIVWGLASVIIGEALVGQRSLGLTIIGAVMGSVLFRLLVAIALRWGLNPNDLKLITAVFVFAALVLPGFIKKLKPRKSSPSN
ncbi:ABC transporter permease [Cerasicoccus fimbriatus]|uniref:ABC transporter permease n=1 Tax=Cerasicoccus fimbriatus TaxID=3014554 RepID=UPI0022B47BB8|nr:ABC transporter permease [Cerasicoccus sp. TK19100]